MAELHCSILAHGFARLRLSVKPIAAVLRAASDFFALDLPDKARHASADQNFGFRRMGTEYSVSPERPDVNDCFTLWSDRLDLIPEAQLIPQLTSALLELRAELMPIVRDTLLALGAPEDAPPPFARASHLQVNHYLPAGDERELLQERHEDGHLLTLLHAQEPGLEIFVGSECVPVTTAPDEILVMPGSILTALTNGAILPLEHQVRNLHLPRRQSVMYFVNPELHEPIHPWRGDRRRDLRERVRRHPATFGLPSVPAL